jgi:hypothetical protein
MIEIASFKRMDKNTLKGFITVNLTNVGIQIRDICLHRKGDRQWLAMPARGYEDSQGNKKWSYVIDWTDENKKRVFESTVFGLLREGGHGKSS